MSKKVKLPEYCDWIKEEYFYLHSQIEEFDKKALQIKQWSVTIAIAGIGTAYWKGVAELLLLSSLSALLFWFLETQWKLFQQSHLGRIRVIERYLRFPVKEFAPLQIHTYWNRCYKKTLRGFKCFFTVLAWRAVWIPHGAIAVAGVALYFYLPPTAAFQIK